MSFMSRSSRTARFASHCPSGRARSSRPLPGACGEPVPSRRANRRTAIALGGLPGDNSAMYDAAAWHDYFLMVGGGAAALTGLVFVAMSIHLDQIALNAAHRHRARTVLTALTAVFIRSALVLMAKQSGQSVAVELIVVLIV